MAKRQTWRVGSVFEVTLCDNSSIAGQVIGIEPDALNSFIGAFYDFDPLVHSELQTWGSPVSVQFVTRDLLDRGVWRVVSEAPPISVDPFFPLPELREAGFVGVRVVGSGMIVKLFEAIHGLYPWNGFADPAYLNKLLADARQQRVLPDGKVR